VKIINTFLVFSFVSCPLILVYGKNNFGEKSEAYMIKLLDPSSKRLNSTLTNGKYLRLGSL
jgi:hypothetical protein